jgi:uncharacterized protein (TIGR02246 family)
MAARAPEELASLRMERFNAGDLEGLAALYEPDARMVAEPGRVVSGRLMIRAMYDAFMAGGTRIEIAPRRMLTGTDVALVSNDWHITGTNPDGSPVQARGTSEEVLRRQPDGTWLYAIDDPFSRS